MLANCTIVENGKEGVNCTTATSRTPSSSRTGSRDRRLHPCRRQLLRRGRRLAGTGNINADPRFVDAGTLDRNRLGGRETTISRARAGGGMLRTGSLDVRMCDKPVHRCGEARRSPLLDEPLTIPGVPDGTVVNTANRHGGLRWDVRPASNAPPVRQLPPGSTRLFEDTGTRPASPCRTSHSQPFVAVDVPQDRCASSSVSRCIWPSFMW